MKQTFTGSFVIKDRFYKLQGWAAGTPCVTFPVNSLSQKSKSPNDLRSIKIGGERGENCTAPPLFPKDSAEFQMRTLSHLVSPSKKKKNPISVSGANAKCSQNTSQLKQNQMSHTVNHKCLRAMSISLGLCCHGHGFPFYDRAHSLYTCWTTMSPWYTNYLCTLFESNKTEMTYYSSASRLITLEQWLIL